MRVPRMPPPCAPSHSLDSYGPPPSPSRIAHPAPRLTGRALSSTHTHTSPPGWLSVLYLSPPVQACQEEKEAASANARQVCFYFAACSSGYSACVAEPHMLPATSPAHSGHIYINLRAPLTASQPPTPCPPPLAQTLRSNQRCRGRWSCSALVTWRAA